MTAPAALRRWLPLALAVALTVLAALVLLPMGILPLPALVGWRPAGMDG